MTKKKIAIWIRVSTEDQAKGESPEHHEKRARLYAESQDWEIVTVYHLEAVSGKSVMDHKETQRMLKDLSQGRISGLIFSKLARLARNTRELLEFAEIFQKHGADLISMQELINTSNPAGRLFFTIIAAMAQWEREEIAERVSASVPIRASMGKSLGGAPPYGYDRIDGKLVINQKEAEIRKLMFELFDKHQKKKQVARLLNQMGFTTRSGGAWTDTTLVRLLQDPIAKGLRRANYSKSQGPGKGWKEKPKENWVFTPAPAIVSEELWDRVNKILDEQAVSNKKVARQTVHLFSGIVVCHCGTKMYVPSNSPKYTCFTCRNKISTEDLEAIFHDQLNQFLYSDDELKQFIHGTTDKLNELTQIQKTLEKSVNDLFQKQESLIALHTAGKLTVENFDEHYNPVATEYKLQKEELDKLNLEIRLESQNSQDAEVLITDARDLYSSWPKFSQEDKRRLIEGITEKIVVEKDEIHIELKYLPAPTLLESMAKGQHNHKDSCLPQA